MAILRQHVQGYLLGVRFHAMIREKLWQEKTDKERKTIL